MTLYMTQFRYTAEAIAAMTENPQDRSVGVKNLVEALGGKFHSLYLCFGEYDGVGIIEMPDDVTELAGLMAMATAGHLSALKTTVLIPMEDTVEAMKMAGKLIYKAPE